MICFPHSIHAFLCMMSLPWMLALIASMGSQQAQGVESGDRKIPVICSMDLWYPAGDPDDHFDLATVYAIQEFDVLGIVIDRGGWGQGYRVTEGQCGDIPMRQMNHLTGRNIPYAHGLPLRLRTVDDTALDQPADGQGGVDLIIRLLKSSPDKVVLIATGSARDFAVAYNRDPALFASKVREIYVIAGGGVVSAGERPQVEDEFNVAYDTLAFKRIMLAKLPITWFPVGSTHYTIDLKPFLLSLPKETQNFFAYVWRHPSMDPISYLHKGADDMPFEKRNMWCTVAITHAAGRKIYKTPSGFAAMADQAAGLAEGVTPASFYDIKNITIAEAKVETKATMPDTSDRSIFKAQYVGIYADKVGMRSSAPDGLNDLCAVAWGMPKGKTIRNVSLSQPQMEKTWKSEQSAELDCHLHYEIVQDLLYVFWDHSYVLNGKVLPLLKASGFNGYETRHKEWLNYQLVVTYMDGSADRSEFKTPWHSPLAFTVTESATHTGVKLFTRTPERSSSSDATYSIICGSVLLNLIKEVPITSEK